METYQRSVSDGSAPSIVINSIDVRKMLQLFADNRIAEVTKYLGSEIDRLAKAEVSVGLLAANTPHAVFAELAQSSPIPLISIVDVTCAEAINLNLNRLALFGTRFTMQGRFYCEEFSARDLSVVLPSEEDQRYLHEKYMNEFLNGTFLPATRRKLLDVVRRLKHDADIDGVILGGTELPFILNDAEFEGIRFLDTTQIHVRAAVASLLA